MAKINRDSVTFHEGWVKYRNQLKQAYRLFDAGVSIKETAQKVGISYDRARTWHYEYLSGRMLCRIAKGAKTRRMLTDPRIRSYQLKLVGFCTKDIASMCGYPESDIKRFIAEVEEMIQKAFEGEF